jgi:hypothetical protein
MGNWMVRTTNFSAKKNQWAQSYQLQEMGLPEKSPLWFGWYIDGAHVAELTPTGLVDRTYTGLGGGGARHLTADENYVYAVGGSSNAPTVYRLPMGGTEWENWSPPAWPAFTSWNFQGPFVFHDGYVYLGIIQLNLPEMPFSAGRARTFHRIPLTTCGDGGVTQWERIFYSYQGFFFCNNFRTWGKTAAGLYMSPGQREQGPVDQVAVGTDLLTLSLSTPTGMAEPNHSFAFGAEFPTGYLNFSVLVTGDGQGINVSSDGDTWEHITPNIQINNATGCYNLGSDGQKLVWVKKGDVFDSPQIIGGTNDVDWIDYAAILGVEGSQIAFWDLPTNSWWLTYNDHIYQAKQNLSVVLQSYDTQALLGYGGAADVAVRLPSTAGAW